MYEMDKASKQTACRLGSLEDKMLLSPKDDRLAVGRTAGEGMTAGCRAARSQAPPPDTGRCCEMAMLPARTHEWRIDAMALLRALSERGPFPCP
jgi:hypothetical protein